MFSLSIHKRKFPHRYLNGSVYFITCTLHPEFLFTGVLSNDEILYIKRSMLFWHEKRWFCHSLTIMPDHAHLVVSILPDNNEHELIGKLLASVKGHSARELNKLRNRKGIVWLHESYDRIIRNENEYWEKMKYIYENAMKRGLVEDGRLYIGYWSADHFPE